MTSRDICTLPKRIWDGLQDRVDPTIASVSVILIAVTLVLLLLDLFLRQRRSRRQLAQADNGAARDGGLPAGAGA